MASIEKDPELLRDLVGKTVIITGGAHGIGASTVTLFHNHGANVIIADLPSAQASATNLITSLSSSNTTSNPKPKVIYIPTDITDWSSMTQMFKKSVEEFGQVDVVVANAGTMETKRFYDEEDVDESGDLKEPREAYGVVDVNVKGTMNTVRLGMHYLRKNPLPTSQFPSRGSIILLLSTSSYFGGTSVPAYVTSKHALLGLLRSSQLVASQNSVRINAIAPFFTPTHITSNFARQWKEAGLDANSKEDVAWAVALMAAGSREEKEKERMSGKAWVVAGAKMVEVEERRGKLVESWMGRDVSDLMKKGAELFASLGGYPLPNDRRD